MIWVFTLLSKIVNFILSYLIVIYFHLINDEFIFFCVCVYVKTNTFRGIQNLNQFNNSEIHSHPLSLSVLLFPSPLPTFLWHPRTHACMKCYQKVM